MSPLETTCKQVQLVVELDDTDLQIAVNQANRNFQELTSPTAIAAAELAVASAMQSVKDTQTKVIGLNIRALRML